MSKQYLFRIGERVELVSCPGFPGTVTGFASTKIRVKSMTSEMNLLAVPAGELAAHRKAGPWSITCQKVFVLEHAFCSLVAVKNESYREPLAARFLERGSRLVKRHD
jgi:hypothetical protein